MAVVATVLPAHRPPLFCLLSFLLHQLLLMVKLSSSCLSLTYGEAEQQLSAIACGEAEYRASASHIMKPGAVCAIACGEAE